MTTETNCFVISCIDSNGVFWIIKTTTNRDDADAYMSKVFNDPKYSEYRREMHADYDIQGHKYNEIVLRKDTRHTTEVKKYRLTVTGI